jgi:hypothetical protein
MMKVSAFTFIRNAVKYDYPVVESIKSVLPLVDEFIVCVGNSDDGTETLIQNIGSSKIKIVPSVWDDGLREGGKVLAVETNKALDATAADSDWLFYIQGDEVVHEKYVPAIKKALEKYKNDKSVEGLLFRFVHFYGSFHYVADGRKWYSHEVRIIRNNKEIRSYRDAQGFRINDRKLKVKRIDAAIYHYGWVKNPVHMQKKRVENARFWIDEEGEKRWMEEVKEEGEHFDYSKIDSLSLFEGSHPAVMKERVEKEDWAFQHNIKKKNFKNIKYRFLYFLDKKFGWRPFEYRNYKLV